MFKKIEGTLSNPHHTNNNNLIFGNNVLFSLYKVFKSNKISKQKLADDVGFVWDSTELRPW